MSDVPQDLGWIVRIAREHADCLATVRCDASLEVMEDGEVVWARGPVDPSGPIAARLALPGDHFEVLPDNQLRLRGAMLPSAWLPTGEWTSVADYVEITAATPRWATANPHTVQLSLVRSSAEREPGVLVTTIRAWSKYAASASQWRLDRWQFAATADGRIAVVGQPIPSLPGERFSVQAGIAIPCGWRIEPPVDPTIARELFPPDGIIIWQADQTWSYIADDTFVSARRAAVRATAAAIAGGQQ